MPRIGCDNKKEKRLVLCLHKGQTLLFFIVIAGLAARERFPLRGSRECGLTGLWG